MLSPQLGLPAAIFYSNESAPPSTENIMKTAMEFYSLSGELLKIVVQGCSNTILSGQPNSKTT